MTRYAWILTGLALLQFPLQSQADDYPAVDVAFQKPAESLKLVSKAVKLTLLDRHWRVDAETDTSVRATLDRPDQQLFVTITIAFNASKATISYVDSKALFRGPMTNHGPPPPGVVSPSTYEGWIDNLAKDMPIQLERVRILLN